MKTKRKGQLRKTWGCLLLFGPVAAAFGLLGLLGLDLLLELLLVLEGLVALHFRFLGDIHLLLVGNLSRATKK